MKAEDELRLLKNLDFSEIDWDNIEETVANANAIFDEVDVESLNDTSNDLDMATGKSNKRRHKKSTLSSDFEATDSSSFSDESYRSRRTRSTTTYNLSR